MAEEENDEPSAPFWMATFSDMVTLLMTFFIMLVAMSEVQVKKFKEALSYFQGRRGLLQNEAVIPPNIPPPPEAVLEQTHEERQEQIHEERQAMAIRYEELLAYLEEEGLADRVTVNLTERGLHVVMSDALMFTSGSAELIEPSRSVLREVAGVMGPRAAAVVVEGHTDDRPIRTSAYPSNWELSAARASSVVRFLHAYPESPTPDRFVAVGYGEFRPLASNEDADGRARNRRVEILFSFEPWQNETRPYLKRTPATPLTGSLASVASPAFSSSSSF